MVPAGAAPDPDEMSDPDRPERGDRPDRADRRSREPARAPAPVDSSVDRPVGIGPEQPEDGDDPPDGPVWMPV